MLSYLVIQLFRIYSFIILVYCIMSWVPMPREGVLADINNVLKRLCDPFLDIFRRFIPAIGGAVDISPIVALFALQLVASLLVRIL